MPRKPRPRRSPLTSLEPQETSFHGDGVEKTIRSAAERKAAKRWDEKSRHGPPPKPACATETAFRHRGWLARRERVLEALRVAEQPAGSIDNFFNCGASCEVLIAHDGQSARLEARYCKSRFCVPCMKARSRVISDNLLAWTAGKQPLMVTLTCAPREGSVGVVLTHLLKSFARLRASQLWKDCVQSGAYCVEITRGQHGDHWHIHLHAICIGSYIAQEALSDAWFVASRGSYIVHVTRCDAGGEAVRYASEYASKGWSSECLENVDCIVDLIRGLRSRRMFGTFGGWRGRRIEKPEVAIDGFRRLGPLVAIVNKAQRGDAWAIGVCRLIGVTVISDAGQVSFISLRPDRKMPVEVDRDTLDGS